MIFSDKQPEVLNKVYTLVGNLFLRACFCAVDAGREEDYNIEGCNCSRTQFFKDGFHVKIQISSEIIPTLEKEYLYSIADRRGWMICKVTVNEFEFSNYHDAQDFIEYFIKYDGDLPNDFDINNFREFEIDADEEGWNRIKNVVGSAHLIPEKTGLPVDIWSVHKYNIQEAFIKPITSSYTGEDIFVSVEEQPKILYSANKEFSEEIMKYIQQGVEYIGRNHDLFFKHCMDTDDSFDDEALFNALRERSEYK